MLDGTDLIRVVKKAAVQAVEASRPANLVYGTITSVTPLQVTVEQKLPLGGAQLAVAESLTRRPIEITINGQTHTGHIESSLQVGEHVLLFRRQGGQQYVIIDRVV